MLDVISIAEEEGEDPCQAIIGAFMFAQRRSYEVLANITRPEWTPPRMRSAIAAVLTGEVAAQVSLLHNKRLANVLIEDGDAPKKRLLQVLPAAIMQEWDNPPDEYSPLLRRVTHLLEGGGSEQEHLGRLGKLATRPPTIAGGEDEDLAEFERQETLRQNLERLRGWIQNAGFSTREAQVCELDLETDFDTEAIAQRLDKSPSTVRQWRRRYVGKIREAAGL